MKIHLILLNIVVGIVLMNAMSINANSQTTFDPDNWKNWNSVRFSIKGKSDLSFNIGYSQGFSFAPYGLDWLQNVASARYKVNRKSSLNLTYRNTIIFRSNNNRNKHRITLAYSRKIRMRDFRLSHSLLGEWHSKKETKFRYRIIYSARLQTRRDLLIPSINLAPYISTAFFYNIGGNAIQQFDTNNEYIGQFVPYGLHRARLTIGVAFSPSKNINVSVFTIRQQEFNTDFAYLNRINVYNPIREKVIRPFNNYFVFGVGVRYNINLKKRNRTQSDFDQDDDVF